MNSNWASPARRQEQGGGSRNRANPILAAVSMALTLACPETARASFGVDPCQDAGCYFQAIGILVGMLGGIPVASLIVLAANVFTCHPLRSRTRQASLGIVFGAVAYEVSALVVAYEFDWLREQGVYRPEYPILLFLATFAMSAFLSVEYARSAPASDES